MYEPPDVRISHSKRDEWMTVGGTRDEDGDLYHQKCLAPTSCTCRNVIHD